MINVIEMGDMSGKERDSLVLSLREKFTTDHTVNFTITFSSYKYDDMDTQWDAIQDFHQLWESFIEPSKRRRMKFGFHSKTKSISDIYYVEEFHNSDNKPCKRKHLHGQILFDSDRNYAREYIDLLWKHFQKIGRCTFKINSLEKGESYDTYTDYCFKEAKRYTII